MSEATTTQSSEGQGQSGQATGSNGGNQSAGTAGTSTTTALERPSWAPDAAWKPDTGLDQKAYGDWYGKEVAPKLTAYAAEVARKAQLPQKPDDVVIAPPKDWKPPEGLEFKIDANSPAYGKVRELAIKHGLSQDTVSDLIGVYGDLVMGDAKTIETARAAELQKLGANAPQRVDAINTWLAGMIGHADARKVGNMLVTADIIAGFEKMIAKTTTQGAAGFTARRDPGARGAEVLSEEAYAKLRPGEKWNYANQFDQSQFVKKRA
jgi:hypothetical protein